MLKLLLGRDQYQLSEEVLRQAAAGKKSLIIVPEQYSHETERRLCRVGGDTVSPRAEVLTFSRLAQRVFQEWGGSARPVLDRGGRLLLMHLAVQRMAGELGVFAHSVQKASFLSALIATSDECKSCCIPPEQLLEAADTAEGDSGRRLRELGLIFGAYQALTADRAEDPRDKLTRLAQVLKDSDYLRGKSVYLDRFTDFTPQEKLVLAVMLRQCPALVAALRCDGLDAGGAGVFDPVRRTALGLVALARDNAAGMEYECLPRDTQLPSELVHLEAELFAPNPTGFDGVCTAVVTHRAGDPYAETEWVAEEILRLVREEGLHWRDISVAPRTLDDWGDRLESVLRRYGIPVFLSRMDDILQKPVLTLLTAALDTVSGGYEYDDLFRYLKTGLTGITVEERDELENYVLRWDIRGGRWTQEPAWSWHPGGYSQDWTPEDRAQVERLDALRRRVIAPLEELRSHRSGTGKALAQAVFHFLEAIDLPACLSLRVQTLAEDGALEQAEEYRQVWDVLTGALEQCADLLEEDVLPLADFAQLVQLVLSQYQVGAIPVSLDRVTCGDMARVSHSTGSVLFLVGADDEHMPQIHQETGLLTDGDRALLALLGAQGGLTPDERMDREMLLIYECCTMPRKRLYVSWAGHGMDGGEKRPSFLMTRLEGLFPGGMGAVPTPALPGAFSPALDRAAAAGDRELLRALSELPGGALAQKAMDAMTALRDDLSPEAVQALYKGKVRLSASRMDKVKSCHYSYFLQYGLKAKARRPAGLDAPEAGTFVHYVLEHVLRWARERGGVRNVERDALEAEARRVTRQYIREDLGGMENKTPRFRYLFRRLAESAVQVVEQMVEELQNSDFEPVAFELGFGVGGELPPVTLTVDGITVAVSGVVDRVDGWSHDGRLYLRVMDYKTGHKSFDLTDVWHGLNLQMLLYLFTLEDKGLPGDDRPIVPAGVLYLPAREEMLSGSRTMEEQQRRRALDAKLRRSGLILNDPNVIDAMEHINLGEDARFIPVRVSRKTGVISGDNLASAVQLGKLHRHIRRILRDIGREVGGGCIQADPWFRDERRTACTYCDYASACHFEDGRRGERSRYLYPVQGTRFWEQMDEETETEALAAPEKEV